MFPLPPRGEFLLPPCPYLGAGAWCRAFPGSRRSRGTLRGLAPSQPCSRPIDYFNCSPPYAGDTNYIYFLLSGRAAQLSHFHCISIETAFLSFPSLQAPNASTAPTPISASRALRGGRDLPWGRRCGKWQGQPRGLPQNAQPTQPESSSPFWLELVFTSHPRAARTGLPLPATVH